MSVSPLNLIREERRRRATRDDKFYRKYLYYFELRVPAIQASDEIASYFFPLMLNPETITMDEPFTVEQIPTLGGGLYVEEDGIVARNISISGTTGFKPRRLAATKTALSALQPDKKSFSRHLPLGVLDAISGQLHFHYLQDAVFRTYADFKRDPATSEGTALFWHAPQDDEHWRVIPLSFKMERNSQDRVLYRYDIQLLAVDGAADADKDFSEDKSLFDAMKDSIRMVQSGVNLVSGAINDVTALVGEIRNFVQDIDKIIAQAATIIRAATAFIEGTTALIRAPYASLDTLREIVAASAEAWETLEESGAAIGALPANIKQKFRQIQDAMDLIGTHPAVFESSARATMRVNKSKQELLGSVSVAEQAVVNAKPSPTTLEENKNLGTSPSPGDLESAKSELGIGREVFEYTGSRVEAITQGDSLVSLSARFLGDARLWQHIAVLNGLKPPFLDEQANIDLTEEDNPLAKVLGIGGKILIPTFAKSPQQLPTLPVLGVRLEESAENQILGTDFEFEPVAGRPGATIYDFKVNSDGGSVDAAQVSGVANLVQVILSNLRTEKGSSTLYKKFGLERVVGLNIAPIDLELARFRMLSALQRDPRITSVLRMSFDTTQNDALVIDADAAIRGFSQALNISGKL